MVLPIRRDGPPPHIPTFTPPQRADDPGKERGRFYRRAPWRKCRLHKLSLNPLCEMCSDRGEAKPATQVHHIKDRAVRPDLEYTLSNLQSLCHACHSRLTAGRDGGRWRNGGGNQSQPS